MEEKPSIHQMELVMAKERADFIATQSDKIALRAIDRHGLMVSREFDNYKLDIYRLAQKRTVRKKCK